MRVSISVTEDTAERLKQYAFENHMTVSGAITSLIWKQKVKNENLPEQTTLERNGKK